MTDTTHALEVLKATLTEELSSLALYRPDTDDWELRLDHADSDGADENAQSDAAEAAEEDAATLALLETQYRAVVRALKKVDAGTYGQCEVCGTPIEAARLNINPAARTCIADRENEGTLPY